MYKYVVIFDKYIPSMGVHATNQTCRQVSYFDALEYAQKIGKKKGVTNIQIKAIIA